MFVRTSTWDKMEKRVRELETKVRDLEYYSRIHIPIDPRLPMTYCSTGPGWSGQWSNAKEVLVADMVRTLFEYSNIEWKEGTPSGFQKKTEPQPIQFVGDGVTAKPGRKK